MKLIQKSGNMLTIPNLHAKIDFRRNRLILLKKQESRLSRKKRAYFVNLKEMSQTNCFKVIFQRKLSYQSLPVNKQGSLEKMLKVKIDFIKCVLLQHETYTKQFLSQLLYGRNSYLISQISLIFATHRIIFQAKKSREPFKLSYNCQNLHPHYYYCAS